MDAKGWGVAEGRSVAVLRVEPVAAPPCMWDGRVFQRVTGATEPVTDQSVMAELVQRGRAARERAERSARDLAASLVKVPTDAPSGCTRLAVAVSPIGPAASWAERLFTLPVQTRALRAIARWSGRHRTHVDAFAKGQHGVDCAAYTVEISEFGRVVWGVVCMDNGTVGAWSEQPERVTVHDLHDTYLGRPWRAALEVARGGESSGPAFVAFATGLGARPGPGDLPLLEPPVVLGVQSLEDPAESDVERVQRMIRRVGGEVIFDPAGAEETSST